METTLVWFDQARHALAQAKTLDEIKDIRDKAEALRLYTKQAGEGLEMQNWCAEIKLRAERRAGELLKERATDLHPVSRERRLPEGISHIKSHRWQTIADLPEGAFEAHIAATKASSKELTSASVYKFARGEAKEAAREAKRVAECGPLPEDVTLWVGDFRECCQDIPDASVDLILTDPPYGRDFLPRIDDLGAMAARVLKPGGSLFLMFGQLFLLEAMQSLHRHLRYQWVFSYRLHGSATAQHASHVHNHWKPFLWYVQGHYAGDYQGDVVDTEDVPDKRFDPWGQSVGGFALLVRRISKPGDLILESLLRWRHHRTGSTALAAPLYRYRHRPRGSQYHEGTAGGYRQRRC
jgi:hypothetical protein